MSNAASEAALESSGDKDPAVLPPSGRAALVESDPELTAFFSWAADGVRFKSRPPPCPERLRLDDWYLGAAHIDHQHPAPMPFFSEVHEEVIKASEGTFFWCHFLPHYSRWWVGQGVRGDPPRWSML